MAYEPRRLSVIAYSGGFTLWHYAPAATPEPAGALLRPGYFNAAAPLLRPGDFLIANAAGTAAILVVSESAAGQVSLTALASAATGAPRRRTGRRRRLDAAVPA